MRDPQTGWPPNPGSWGGVDPAEPADGHTGALTAHTDPAGREFGIACPICRRLHTREQDRQVELQRRRLADHDSRNS